MSISTRVLRKFGGDKDLIQNQANELSDSEETLFGGGVKKKQFNVNRFDLLNQQSQSESEVKEDDDDNDQESKTVSNASQVRESAKRKKKKKRKKAAKSNLKQSSDDVDEVERSIEEVNEVLGDTIHPVQLKENATCNSPKGILCIEHKHLNPKTELKRIFGLKIIQNEPRRKGHGRRNIKTTWLVTPKEYWPPISKLGLSMKLLESKNDVKYFTFEHSLSYQNVQKRFLEAVESLDPDGLIAILHSTPCHVDTLIQLSDLSKLSDNLSMAAEFVERALYTLESAFHPLFNVAKGSCRLDYRRQENRAFYIALFKHLTFVGQRACYRTALEFCKLIFSLDPKNDPLAIVLTIDFYALRSREFDWFLRFVEQLDPERNLSQLPNIAFSKAVALFQLSDPSSNIALQEALLMFPSVLLPLLDICGVQPDAKTQAHSYFTNSSSSCIPAALNLLIQLYIQRNYHIWKEPDTLAWLEKNTLEVLKRVDAEDPLVRDYAEKRRRRFEAKTPREIERHVFLSDIKKVTAVLADVSNIGTTFSFDPLPPLDSIDLYKRPERPIRTYESSNPLSLYFRSLMPDFNPEVQLHGQNGAGQNQSHIQSLQQNMRNVLSAMVDLLSNLRPTGNEEDSSGDENDDDDEDYNVGESPF